jgi:hypothetical protein
MCDFIKNFILFFFLHLTTIEYNKNNLINVKIWIDLDGDDNDDHDGGSSHDRDPDCVLDLDHDLDDCGLDHDCDPDLDDHGDDNDVFLLFYDFSKQKMVQQQIELEVLLIFVVFYHIPILLSLHFD